MCSGVDAFDPLTLKLCALLSLIQTRGSVSSGLKLAQGDLGYEGGELLRLLAAISPINGTPSSSVQGECTTISNVVAVAVKGC